MENFITPDQVFIGKDLKDREEVIRFLSDVAVEQGYATDAEALYAAYMVREGLGATGMQDGFAIPHAKDETVTKPGIFVVKLARPVEWPSYDRPEASVVIGLVVPLGDADAPHIKLLSQIAVMLMHEDFRASMREATDPETVAALIESRLAE